MYLGIDHLVIAVADPDEAVAAFERAVGRAPTGGGRHDALGTFNRVVWLGDTYIEFIGVFDPGLAEDSWVRPAGPPGARGGRRVRDVGDRHRRPRCGPGRLTGCRVEPRRRPIGRAATSRWRGGSLAAGGRRDPRADRATVPDRTRRDGRGMDARRSRRARCRGGAAWAGRSPSRPSSCRWTTRTRRASACCVPSGCGSGRRWPAAARATRASGRQIVRLRPRRGGGATPAIRLRAALADERTIELFGCRWVVVPRSLTDRPEVRACSAADSRMIPLETTSDRTAPAARPKAAISATKPVRVRRVDDRPVAAGDQRCRRSGSRSG